MPCGRKQQPFPNIVLENDGLSLYSQKVGDPKSNNHIGLAARDRRGKASITARTPNTFDPSKPGAVRGEEDKHQPHGPASVDIGSESFRHLPGFS